MSIEISDLDLGYILDILSERSNTRPGGHDERILENLRNQVELED